MLTSNFQTSTEPTDNEATEIEIQQLTTKLLPSEMSKESSKRRNSADEQYAKDLFKANSKFEHGQYWANPLFNKDYTPMLNNYNIELSY